MTVDILDADKLIRLNHLKEVTNPTVLTSSLSFSPDSFLSNDIFGYSIQQRQTTFAYIDLQGHYIHPLFYNEIFSKTFKIVPRIISGDESVVVKGGKLISDPNGWTGIENLYKHWDEITNYGATETSVGNQILPEMAREDVFIDKFVVIPPFYHDADINHQTHKVKLTELTSMYATLLTDILFKQNNVSSFDIVTHGTTLKIQEQLVTISNYLQQALAKKTGYIRQRLLSKKIDYGVRSVLTAPSFTGKDIDLNTLEYEKLYMPINLLTSAAYPFIVRFVTEYFQNIENNVLYDAPDNQPDHWKIYEPEYQFDSEYIKTLIDNFNHFSASRFDPISIKIENISTGEQKEVVMKERKTFYKDKNFSMVDHTEITPVTITDICFRACYDSCYDRYAMFTRYPVLTSYGIFFAKIDILSTINTVPCEVIGQQYQKYPIIEPKLPKADIESRFYNTVKFSISRLEGLEHRHEASKPTELRGVSVRHNYRRYLVTDIAHAA